MIHWLYTIREGKPSDHASIADAAPASAHRVMSTGGVLVRLLTAAALASMPAAPQATAWAQDAEKSPPVITADCFEVLQISKDEVLIRLTKGQLQGDFNGAPLIKFPTPCLSDAKRVVPPQPSVVTQPPSKEDYDAKAMRSTLEELVKYLKAKGVPPENLTQPQRVVDDMIERNKNKDDVREPLRRASEEASKGDDATTAALLGMMTAGCVALSGGAACALLPAIFGDLFKGRVTQEQIEGATRIAKKIGAGRTLDAKDYDLLKDLGAEEWATQGLRALQSGKYEEFLVAVARKSGASADKISLMQKLAKKAETEEITCAVLNGLIGSSITVDTKTRRAIGEIVFRSRKSLSTNQRDELKTCLDLALAGGG